MLEYSIGRVRETQGKVGPAQEAFGRALVENLAFYPGHTALARLALAANDTATALKEYEQAVELAPGRADLRYGLGVLLMRRQSYDAAAEQFRLAVEADSYYVRPYYPLAFIRESEGKDSLAIAYYTHFIAWAPASLASQVADARKRLADVKQLYSESH
jgi:Tfp pilus assembly protein PilF